MGTSACGLTKAPTTIVADDGGDDDAYDDGYDDDDVDNVA